MDFLFLFELPIQICPGIEKVTVQHHGHIPMFLIIFWYTIALYVEWNEMNKKCLFNDYPYSLIPCTYAVKSHRNISKSKWFAVAPNTIFCFILSFIFYFILNFYYI